MRAVAQASRRAAFRSGRALALWWAFVRFGASPALRRLLRLAPAEPSVAVRVRLAFEHLGLTYLKLGQYLAMRFDILPAEICQELGRLFEDVAPMPPDLVAEIIEEELGAPLDTLFAEFGRAPVAAASIGQVHAARTRDGERVAVKVQRPGIGRVLQADTANLRVATRLADLFHLLGRLSATEMLDQFLTWTLRELDFVVEGRTAEAVGAEALEYEKIPHVRWDLTCPRVLTLEYIDGLSLAQVVAAAERDGPGSLAATHPGLDVDLVLHHLTFALLHQIFVRGLFHGDPHPGNVIVLDGNGVAFVDFGIFGTLMPFDQEVLSGQIENLAVGQIEESLRFYWAQLSTTEWSDIEAFQRESRAVLQAWYDVSLRPGAPLEERHVGKYTGQMIDISRRCGLRYDMSYLLYWRALNALDSTSLRLTQHFDLIAELKGFFAEIRSGPVERALDAVSNPRNVGLVTELVETGSTRVQEAIARIASAGPVESAALTERSDLVEASDTHVRGLTGALAGLSLLVVFARTETASPLRSSGIVVASVIMAASLLWALRP